MIFNQRKEKVMKGFILTLLLAVMLSVSAYGQGWTTNAAVSRSNSEMVIDFVGVLDTAAGTYDSLLSMPFSLEDFDGYGYFTIYHLFTSAAGAPNCLVDIYFSEDNVTYTSFAQLVDSTVSEAATWAAFQLSNARAKYYKLGIEQVAPGRDDTAFEVKIRAYLKDPAVTN